MGLWDRALRTLRRQGKQVPELPVVLTSADRDHTMWGSWLNWRSLVAANRTAPEKDHSIWGSWLTWESLLKKRVGVDVISGPNHGKKGVITAKAGSGKTALIALSVALSMALAKSEEAKQKRPPRAARFLLLLIPKRNREHLLGDLEEEYRTIVLPEYGRFWAKLWYCEQAAIAVGFYVWPFIKRILGLAAIWKVIGR